MNKLSKEGHGLMSISSKATIQVEAGLPAHTYLMDKFLNSTPTEAGYFEDFGYLGKARVIDKATRSILVRGEPTIICIFTLETVE